MKNVIAFEPSNEVLEIVKSKYKNENRVKIIPKALSDKNGLLKFHECNDRCVLTILAILKSMGVTPTALATRLDDEAALQTCDNILYENGYRGLIYRFECGSKVFDTSALHYY